MANLVIYATIDPHIKWTKEEIKEALKKLGLDVWRIYRTRSL